MFLLFITNTLLLTLHCHSHYLYVYIAPAKENQDCGRAFYGVYDGHGRDGHLCSRFVRDHVSSYGVYVEAILGCCVGFVLYVLLDLNLLSSMFECIILYLTYLYISIPNIYICYIYYKSKYTNTPILYVYSYQVLCAGILTTWVQTPHLSKSDQHYYKPILSQTKRYISMVGLRMG